MFSLSQTESYYLNYTPNQSAPTTDSIEDEIETFYEELKQVIKQVKNHEINMIMGDFNAKVLKALVRPYGLGLRNNRGERLCQFCQEENMKITNT